MLPGEAQGLTGARDAREPVQAACATSSGKGNPESAMGYYQFLATGMLAGLFLDVCLGWPDRLFARIGHPVSWIGKLISALELRWNRPDFPPQKRRLLGSATAAVVVLGCLLLGAVVQQALPRSLAGALLLGLLSWPFLAARSLYAHVLKVATPLGAGNVADARLAVSMIVGRDPSGLDESGIARAAIESLAENSSDGVIAPLFWGLIGGLPAMAAYKAVNTLDSMIGHRTERYGMFGFASAKVDDIANIVPARLTGVLLSLSSRRPLEALRCMWRDARRHRSPNAGWPEAAMAGALAVRLSGPRVYGGQVSEEPWLNAGAPDPKAADLGRALGIYATAVTIAAGIVAGALLFLIS